MANKRVAAFWAAVDLSAAFDTVDHLVGLLSKVLSTHSGVSGHCINWFESYLSPRNFKVNINNDYSSAKNLDFSVPQGSVADPTLYSVYATTMKKCVPDNVDLRGYADDHALKKSFLGNDRNSESNTKHVLENSLKQVLDGWK